MRFQKLVQGFVSFFIIFLFVVLISNCQSDQTQQEMTKSTDTPQQVQDSTAEETVRFDFEDLQPGNLPNTWITAITGKGNPGKWEIVTDKNESGPTKVLAQTSMENFGYHFDVAVAKETNFQNLTLSVEFKAIEGEEDQGGGPVWRYKDADNYYIARANPLENNYRVYKVVDGNRKQLKSYSLPVISGQWHSIKIEHIGTQIKCYYNGQLYLEVDDDTFMEAGNVGVWTKADSYCLFDNLVVDVK